MSDEKVFAATEGVRGSEEAPAIEESIAPPLVENSRTIIRQQERAYLTSLISDGWKDVEARKLIIAQERVDVTVDSLISLRKTGAATIQGIPTDPAASRIASIPKLYRTPEEEMIVSEAIKPPEGCVLFEIEDIGVFVCPEDVRPSLVGTGMVSDVHIGECVLQLCPTETERLFTILGDNKSHPEGLPERLSYQIERIEENVKKLGELE